MKKQTITDINGFYALSNGAEMPYLGLGVYASENVIQSVNWAFEAGYRHIDTASFYKNEREVGQAVNNSEISRSEIFVVSKVWNSDQGYDNTIAAFHKSLKLLNLDYLDLYLVHWPVKNKYHDTWKAMEYLYKQGFVRSIGVSNFMQPQLQDLIAQADIVPMVNQIEFHPHLIQQDLINYCQEHHIQQTAWAPLMQGKIVQCLELEKLAQKYNKSIAQIALRWSLQKGIIIIPKSSNKNRIAENANIFDFELTTDDMTYVNSIDKNLRVGPDPMHFKF